MQETRELRALAIAATTQLRPGRRGWNVPSQSGNGSYFVDPDMGFCSCPDHELHEVECKHLLAVRFTMRRDKGSDGTYQYTRQVQVTYTQQWTAYNRAQTEEKDRFLELLADLCRTLDAPRERKPGRPSTPLSVMAFAAAYKVYSRFSSRRFMSDLRAAHGDGLIDTLPCFNSVSHFLANPALTPVGLVRYICASPVAEKEIPSPILQARPSQLAYGHIPAEFLCRISACIETHRPAALFVQGRTSPSGISPTRSRYT